MISLNKRSEKSSKFNIKLKRSFLNKISLNKQYKIIN